MSENEIKGENNGENEIKEEKKDNCYFPDCKNRVIGQCTATCWKKRCPNLICSAHVYHEEWYSRRITFDMCLECQKEQNKPLYYLGLLSLGVFISRYLYNTF